MRKTVRKYLMALAMVPLFATAQDDVPAFPGAEGFGRNVTGGRGGVVYHVTNLNDSGTGSLREALGKSSKRTIVFDVAGEIHLKSDLSISKGNVTIAGQTAPGDGITLCDYTVTVNADNVIMRFIRMRRGNAVDINDGADACWGRRHKNIILDHCSFSWSIDEVASFYDNRNFTMQWCTIAESLTNAGHDKGAHGYGGIWGGKGASFHHNLLAHLNNRVPRFNGARYEWSGYDTSLYGNTMQAERVDFRNCVLYNWGTGGCYGGPGGGYINMVNNYYKAGPGTKNKTRVTQVSVSDASNGGDNPFPGYASRYYINGNYVTAASTPENYDWKGVIFDNGLYTINGEKYIADPNHYYGENQTYVQNTNGVDCIRLKLDEPIESGEVTTHNAQTAFDKVVRFGGASYMRDECDVRYAEEAENGTTTYKGAIAKRAGILDVINDPEGTEDPTTASYPYLREKQQEAGFDTDGDGMPDNWEVANGLDPNNPNDAKETTIDSAKEWYTNLEVYLNSLVQYIMVEGNADADDAVVEYYPAYYNADGTFVAAINAESTGISEANSDNFEPVSTTFYNLDGTIAKQGKNGVFIKVEKLANGTKRVTKSIK